MSSSLKSNTEVDARASSDPHSSDSEDEYPKLQLSNDEESIIAMSESIFFPPSTDSTWRSTTIVREPKTAADVLDLMEGHATSPQHDSSDDEIPVEIRFTNTQDAMQKDQDVKAGGPLIKVQVSSCQSQCPKAKMELSGCKQDEHEILDKHVPSVLITATGKEKSVNEIANKLESGLRSLTELASSNTANGEQLKRIYDAYYRFTDTLFRDIKLTERKSEGMARKQKDKVHFVYDWTQLEEQKQDIYQQEELLEKEILKYKDTKHELEEVAETLELAANRCNAEIPGSAINLRDITPSSSTEYVAEVEQIQKDILMKQECAKSIHSDIQTRYLPKTLVDSVCESHRFAVQTLQDIADETIYLEGVIARMVRKYNIP